MTSWCVVVFCFSLNDFQDAKARFTFAVPSAAPDDVAVEVLNSSVVKVSWVQVQKDKLHGHLGGYRVTFEKIRPLL